MTGDDLTAKAETVPEIEPETPKLQEEHTPMWVYAETAAFFTQLARKRIDQKSRF